jgi:hypothetical protein
MTPSERIAEYEEIAKEVLNELGTSERCRCNGGENQMPHRWFVNIVCDGVLFSASGDEDPGDPYSRNIIKNKIRRLFKII